jgi:hypothetical protein
MAVLATHNPNVSIAITLSPAPADGSSFGIPIHFVPLATNSLNGDVVRAYTSDDDAAADLTSGYIDATARAMLQDAFSQIPKPPIVKLASVDLVGGDDYDDAYAAAKLVDDAFYGVTIRPRTDAEILLMAAAVEADNRIFVLQSDDADWLTASYPAGLSTLEDNERSITAFHDSDAEWLDIAWLASRLVFNPDDKSAPWQGQVRAVADYTAMTAAQRLLALANDANLMLPFFAIDNYMMEGTNCAGRPISHIVSMDWLEYHLARDLGAMISAAAADGRKITVDDEGQAIGLKVIEARLQQGVSAGHFSDFAIDPVTITQTHIDAGQLPYSGVAVLTVGAVKVDLTFNLSTTPLS